MLRSGFTLAQVRCNDFFYDMGNVQTGVQTTKGLIAPLVTILTGIVALRNFQNPRKQDDFLEVIGLASSASMAGLELYEQQFLFGAENIDAVRTMVNSELSASRQTLKAKNLSTFDEVAIQLIEHQMICTPRHIMLQARASINSANMQPVEVTSSAVQNTEREIYENMAVELDLAGSLSSEQAWAFWWLNNNLPPSGKEKNLALGTIYTLLQELDGDKMPVLKTGDNFTENPKFNSNVEIQKLLMTLPASRQAVFRYEVSQKNAEIAQKVAAPVVVGAAPVLNSDIAKKIASETDINDDDNTDKLVTPKISPK